MKQLTVKELLELIDQLKEKYPEEEVLEMPIYLSDDDELNGVHSGWSCEEINVDNEDDEAVLEMINERSGNNPLENKGILIS